MERYKVPKPYTTLDDLCMTTEEWLKYLHKTFEDRYGRPKTEEDEVHIDEIIPCSAWIYQMTISIVGTI
jgi:hypothetical protein